MSCVKTHLRCTQVFLLSCLTLRGCYNVLQEAELLPRDSRDALHLVGGGGGSRSGTVGGRAPRKLFFGFSVREAFQSRTNTDIIQQESLGTDML